MLDWLHTNLIAKPPFEKVLSDQEAFQDLNLALLFEEFLSMGLALQAEGSDVDFEDLRELLKKCWLADSLEPLKKSRYYPIYRQRRAKFRSALLGNNLSPEVSRRYLKFHEECKNLFNAKIENTPGLNERMRDFERNGICAIHGLDVSVLKELGGRIIEESKREERYPHYQKYGDLIAYPNEEQAMKMAKTLFEILTHEEVASTIHSILGSHYQLRFVETQVISSEGLDYDMDVNPSGFWHLDELPSQMFKIFLYLNDVKEENGAMRCFDKEETAWLLEQGFHSNDRESRIQSQKLFTKEVMEKMISLEGGPGTLCVFDPVRVIHKAGKPRVSRRLDLKMSFFPAKEPISLKNVYQAFMVKRCNSDSEFYMFPDYELDPERDPFHSINYPGS